MYAMACIIVELVIWKPLVQVFSMYLRRSFEGLLTVARDSNAMIDLPGLKELFDKEAVVTAFKHQGGEAVFEAVQTCLLTEGKGSWGWGGSVVEGPNCCFGEAVRV